VNFAQLADVLVKTAKQFYKEGLINEIVTELCGSKITDDVVSKVLNPYVTMAELSLPLDVQQMIRTRLDEFVPRALEQIRIDSHMNQADESDTLTQNNAEALLVAFVNQACIPLDLAFYTQNLADA